MCLKSSSNEMISGYMRRKKDNIPGDGNKYR